MLRTRRKIARFIADTSGASMVEYAVTLIVVTLVGAIIFAFGGNIAVIVDASAGAF